MSMKQRAAVLSNDVEVASTLKEVLTPEDLAELFWNFGVDGLLKDFQAKP